MKILNIASCVMHNTDVSAELQMLCVMTRRLALIFSHKTFQQRPTRDGNESEVQQLQETLSKYEFDVQVF
ncbi:hypothetical protein B566_EDAN009241, partial [Ephemera danica]